MIDETMIGLVVVVLFSSDWDENLEIYSQITKIHSASYSTILWIKRNTCKSDKRAYAIATVVNKEKDR